MTFSIDIVWPNVLSLNNLKLLISSEKHFYTRKIYTLLDLPVLCVG